MAKQTVCHINKILIINNEYIYNKFTNKKVSVFWDFRRTRVM